MVPNCPRIFSLFVKECSFPTPTLPVPFESSSPEVVSKSPLSILDVVSKSPWQVYQRSKARRVVSYAQVSPCFYSFACSLSSVALTTLYQHALSMSGWKHLMDKEMSALHQNQT